MKANTQRGGRLNFDRVVDAYDAGRPDLPVSLVERLSADIGLSEGAKVLEIGAATGQLTRALRASGLEVVALEPGDSLRARLVRHLDEGSGFVVRGEFFEEYAGEEGPFAAIWSANAFHWVDPAVSYEKAARLLQPGGHLALIWTYPILRDDLQRELNARVFVEEPSFAHDPATFTDYLTEITEAGRDELLASGAFAEPRRSWSTDTYTLDVDAYVAFLSSYGQMAGREDVEREALGRKVRTALGDLDVDRVEIIQRVYSCLARRLDPEGVS
ncbi:class I SAM-dependent methyltransferase [Actinopolymorpha pittospori]|uniref:SAM-dependent methyltransferase n=1 Tax=Actinopolymorpha pittospori TaxID=648752 RepID=A0A927NC55_9ACTN|nr:methyltransferase domain-containing protein [Actinopolymorpha pittospori]MBE1612822.1 SAM-dependent methyltransferase [Actinopolymorpha pittospori]